MNTVKDSIFRYRNELNKREFETITALYDKIWERLSKDAPDSHDEIPSSEINPQRVFYPVYMHRGVKFIKKDGVVEIMVTHTQPYSPIYNKWILEMIYEGIVDRKKKV